MLYGYEQSASALPGKVYRVEDNTINGIAFIVNGEVGEFINIPPIPGMEKDVLYPSLEECLLQSGERISIA